MGTPVVIDFLLAGVIDSDGSALAGGKVYTYYPGTSTLKNTWIDYAQQSVHANPIVLDSLGAKQVFANGSYDIVIKNPDEDTILYTYEDLNFVSTDAVSLYGGVATGTANAIDIAVTLAPPAMDSGQKFTFKASATNTSTVTLDVNGLGAYPIYDNNTRAALVGGEITSGSFYEVIYYNSTFYLLNADPVWVSYSPTIAGFSANPTDTSYRYTKKGRVVTLFIRQGTAGTSNSATFTLTLPFTAATVINASWQGVTTAMDNNSWLPSPISYVLSGGTVVNINKDAAGTGFTSSGNKKANLTLTYESAS